MRIATRLLLFCLSVFGILLLVGKYVLLPRTLEQHARTVFAAQLNCDLQCSCEYVGFIIPTISFRNIVVQPKNNEIQTSWSWKAEKIVCETSWFEFLRNSSFPLYCDVYGWQGKSSVTADHTIPLWTHINQLFTLKSNNIPTIISHFQFRLAELEVENIKEAFRIFCTFNGTIEKHTPLFEGLITVRSASFISDGQPLIENGTATGKLHFHETDFRKHGITFQGHAVLPTIQDVCLIKGTFVDSTGRFSFTTGNPNFFLDPIVLTQSDITITGRVPIVLGTKYIGIPQCTGTAAVRGTIEQKTNQFKGTVLIEDLCYKNKSLCNSLKCVLNGTDTALSTSLMIHLDVGELFGIGSYNFSTNSGSVALKNKTILRFTQMPYWTIENDTAHCALEKNGPLLKSTCSAVARNTLEKTTHSLHLHGECDLTKVITATGQIGSYPFEMQYNFAQENRGNFKLYDSQNQTIISLCAEPKEKELLISCLFGHELLSTGAQTLFARSIPTGKGEYKIEGVLSDATAEIRCTACLENGAITLPYFNNTLTHAHTNFTIVPNELKCMIDRFEGDLHQGNMRVHNGELQCDSHGKLIQGALPLEITQCAYHIPNVTEGTISGKVNYRYDQKRDELEGTILIHSGKWTNEEFLEEFLKQQTAVRSIRKNSFGETKLALTIKTEAPYLLDTTHFKTTLDAQVVCEGTLTHPQLSGSINAHGGEVHFPYRSLYISHGKILFPGGSVQNSTVELYARNTVKNHLVSLNISGPVEQYYFTLESTPSLSQRQIFSLLFFGSPQEELSIFIPTLQQIKLGGLQLHFMPGFVDKSSRGGVRGALEIAVNDRLRALIQKNFTLSEDTRFELEYAITDTITVRGIRNERRDLGAEVEMRFKF
jgi:hypothetical protein